MKAVHRHSAGHEHEFEPQYGLPEELPAGETLLWQGNPDWRALARRAFHVRKIAIYFAALVALRVAFVLSEGGSAATAALAGGWVAVLGMLALGGLMLMAWLSARGAVYSITNQRVVMRVGVALTVSFNLPYKRIAGAGVQLDRASTTGDLTLALSGKDRIAWLHLWPHVRPWRVARPEPMLRCVPDAERVSQILAQAWSQATGMAAAPADERPPHVAEARDTHAAAQPAMAGR